MEKLAKTWGLGTIRYDDEDITSQFDGFALTITKDKKYTTTGKMGNYDHPPFEASGSWDFADEDLNLINRDDGVNIRIQVTDNTLALTFTITETNGRVSGLGGEYRFDLIAP